ncbi:MAG: glycosyltransferase family 2 protein [Clostridiales bacterium]|nr:glycosyltransferase family 2 protein [Clostridiales bacterium]
MQGILLSVIIPYYNETPEEIFPLLASLNSQVGVDFPRIECILVNDGNHNILPGAFLDIFKNLALRCIFTDENRGPGMARQTGLDAALGEYVMFCDADDLLHNVLVIESFIREVEQYHPEVIVSTWLMEIYDKAKGKFEYAIRDNEFTWMHGKAFNKAFLELKKIRFHEDLRVHEDAYFLRLVTVHATNVRKLALTSYVWKYRPISITRINEAAYTFNSMPAFAKSIGYACAQIEKHFPGQIRNIVLQTVMIFYFYTHQRCWLASEKTDLLRQAEESFSDMIKPYMRHYEDAPARLIASMYNEERARSFIGEVETETLTDWLKRVTDRRISNRK